MLETYDLAQAITNYNQSAAAFGQGALAPDTTFGLDALTPEFLQLTNAGIKLQSDFSNHDFRPTPKDRAAPEAGKNGPLGPENIKKLIAQENQRTQEYNEFYRRLTISQQLSNSTLWDRVKASFQGATQTVAYQEFEELQKKWRAQAPFLHYRTVTLIDSFESLLLLKGHLEKNLVDIIRNQTQVFEPNRVPRAIAQAYQQYLEKQLIIIEQRKAGHISALLTRLKRIAELESFSADDVLVQALNELSPYRPVEILLNHLPVPRFALQRPVPLSAEGFKRACQLIVKQGTASDHATLASLFSPHPDKNNIHPTKKLSLNHIKANLLGVTKSLLPRKSDSTVVYTGRRIRREYANFDYLHQKLQLHFDIKQYEKQTLLAPPKTIDAATLLARLEQGRHIRGALKRNLEKLSADEKKHRTRWNTFYHAVKATLGGADKTAVLIKQLRSDVQAVTRGFLEQEIQFLEQSQLQLTGLLTAPELIQLKAQTDIFYIDAQALLLAGPSNPALHQRLFDLNKAGHPGIDAAQQAIILKKVSEMALPEAPVTEDEKNKHWRLDLQQTVTSRQLAQVQAETLAQKNEKVAEEARKAREAQKLKAHLAREEQERRAEEARQKKKKTKQIRAGLVLPFEQHTAIVADVENIVSYIDRLPDSDKNTPDIHAFLAAIKKHIRLDLFKNDVCTLNNSSASPFNEGLMRRLAVQMALIKQFGDKTHQVDFQQQLVHVFHNYLVRWTQENDARSLQLHHDISRVQENLLTQFCTDASVLKKIQLLKTQRETAEAEHKINGFKSQCHNVRASIETRLFQDEFNDTFDALDAALFAYISKKFNFDDAHIDDFQRVRKQMIDQGVTDMADLKDLDINDAILLGLPETMKRPVDYMVRFFQFQQDRTPIYLVLNISVQHIKAASELFRLDNPLGKPERIRLVAQLKDDMYRQAQQYGDELAGIIQKTTGPNV